MLSLLLRLWIDGARAGGGAQFRDQHVHDRYLAFDDLAHRLLRCEPAGTIGLRKLRHAPGFRWPLHREEIASERRKIEVAFKGPGRDDLPTRLRERAKRDEIALRLAAGL